MKITFLISGSIKSNFSYRALSLARALRKLNHDVAIIAPKADKYNDFKSEAVNEIDGVKIIQPFQFVAKRPEVSFIPYLFGAMKEVLNRKSDLIYIYKPSPISVIGFVGKLFGRPIVITDMDDLGGEVMKIEGHPAYQRKLVEWSEKFAVKYSDQLVVASTYLFEKYRREFPGKLIHILPNGIDNNWLSPVNISKEGKRIVFMGSINRKIILGPLFDILPDIVKKYPDLKVLIIGAGKDMEYFKTKAEGLGVAANVEFSGWLDIDVARSLLYSGDIGYNYMPNEPTTKAASNMKVPQYMARGVVPLVSNIGDLPERVDFGSAGYVSEPGNSEALEKTLVNALEDKDRALKAERARAIASEKFTWDHLASGLNQWIQTN